MLGPSGPLWLSGKFGLRGNGAPGAPVATDWDLRLDLHQCDLRCGIELQRVEGAIRLAGAFDGEKFHSRGELDLDSAIYRDFQFTEVRGPFWIDDQQVLFGGWAAPAAEGQPARSVTAKLLGGTVVGDGHIALGPVPTYRLQARVQDADLARFAQESMPGVQRLSGEISGNVELHVKGPGTAHLGGRGALSLRNADIYELPVMVSLLKILSIRPPDATAFTASDVEFRVQGEHVYLDRIKFMGDAVSLLGQGTVGLNRSVLLTFHAVVGRDEFRVPVVSDLLGGASQQILLIHVEGTLDNPQPRREPFPVVNQAIRQLLSNPSPEPRPPGAPATPRTGAGASWIRPFWRR
jgi:AsmA-like C-terminal region